MFERLFLLCDIIVSFFYDIMFISYSDFVSFLTGDFILSANSLVNNYAFSIQLPNLPIGDIIFDSIMELISLLFRPLPFFTAEIYADTPFYVCFLSFFVNSLILVGIVKLVSFIIELMPFE